MRHEIDAVPELAVLKLSAQQREILADLIEAERAHACRWWTMLNEMRARGQLPDWVKSQAVGTQGDHGEWATACIDTNSALFGKRRGIHTEEEGVTVEVWAGDVLVEVTRRRVPKVGACAESVEQLQEAVLQHLSGEIALVGTNERKSS